MTNQSVLAPPVPVRIERVAAALPGGLETLQAEARAGGYRHLDRLAADWESGALRFDRCREALLVAYIGEEIAGIGGITLDPALPGCAGFMSEPGSANSGSADASRWPSSTGRREPGKP